MKRVLILVMVLCLLCCGCVKEKGNQTESYKLDQSSYKMGKSLTDYTFAINGKVLAFPLNYGDFATCGFELGPELKSATLQNGQYSIYKVSDGFNSTEIYIANFAESKKKITECTVCGVLSEQEQGVKIEMPNGIGFGANIELVKGGFGTPAKEQNNSLLYGDDKEGAKLSFSENGLEKIEYFRIVNPAKLGASAKVPDEIKKYRDPEMLSDNLKDFTFYLYGTTYTMPLPVGRLIEGGWIKVSQISEFIPAGATIEDAVKLTTSNRTLSFGLKNVADYPTTVENCYITSIKSTTDVKLDLTLANGCRVGSTVTNLENTFGKNNFTDIEKKGKKTEYIYIHNGDSKLTVTANNQTGYITEIKLQFGLSDIK